MSNLWDGTSLNRWKIEQSKKFHIIVHSGRSDWTVSVEIPGQGTTTPSTHEISGIIWLVRVKNNIIVRFSCIYVYTLCPGDQINSLYSLICIMHGVLNLHW